MCGVQSCDAFPSHIRGMQQVSTQMDKDVLSGEQAGKLRREASEEEEGRNVVIVGVY